GCLYNTNFIDLWLWFSVFVFLFSLFVSTDDRFSTFFDSILAFLFDHDATRISTELGITSRMPVRERAEEFRTLGIGTPTLNAEFLPLGSNLSCLWSLFPLFFFLFCTFQFVFRLVRHGWVS